MPKILEHQAAENTKMLLIGNSGAGKTGALYSLAEAGYNLRILDLDNGSDILLSLARKGKPEVAERIIYETVTEKWKTLNGKVIVDGPARQFSQAMSLLAHWKIPDIKDASGAVVELGYDLGPVSTWGPQDVLVIDSLTMLSTAAFRHTLTLNGRAGQRPQIGDWGDAMQVIEDFLGMLYSKQIPCNVIVIAHITYIGGDDEGGTPSQGYPATLGNKLPPKVGRYFNSMVLAKLRGTGPSAKRILVTQPEGYVDVKAPVVSTTLPRELPIETGLATFFKAVREGATTAKPTTPAGVIR